MAYDSLTPLPQPPNPDNPATFDTLAYPFTVAQRDMVPELNSFIDALNQQGWPSVQARAQISGTAAAPVWTWEASPDTGIFLQGVGQWAVSTGGIRRLLISTTSITPSLPVLFLPGTSAAPGIAFFGGSNTGLFLQSAGAIGMTVGGTEQVRITEGGQILAVGTGSPAIPSFSWIGDPNTGIYRPGNDQIAISTNGAQRLLATTTALTSSLPFYVPAGTAANPAISPAGDANTGAFFPAADTIAWATGGAERLRLSATGLLTSATAITQDDHDNSQGRLAKVGWMGLGVRGLQPQGANLDNATLNQFFGINSATQAASPSLPFAGGQSQGASGISLSFNEDWGAQLAFSRFTDEVEFRRRGVSAGVWGQWRRLYSSANILGTVSQSGGVPTGAIIERGANANGEYVKFADGTMICKHLLTGIPLTTAAGTMFRSPDRAWTFPAAFADQPAVHVAVRQGSVWGNGRMDGLTSGSVAVYGLVSIASLAVDVTAIGRWAPL